MSATMSILGLYNFDDTIFDNMNLPEEIDEYDRTTIINNLLMECAEFEILYPDPDFMKFAIEQWSKVMLPVWERLYNTTQYEYNPIYNYDRTEEYTDTDSRKIENTRVPNLTEELTHGKVETQSQNSFENAGFIDALKNSNSGKDTSKTTGTETDTEQHSGSIVHNAHLYGNIGVTTTQQMIEQERSISEFNLMTRIISDFQDRFCIMIY